MSDDSDHDQDYSDWEEEAVPCRSLFDSEIFASAQEALQHDAQQHGFDLLTHSAHLDLDFYEYMRLVNHIRKSRCTPSQAKQIDRTVPWWSDDALLQPVLEDDPLLREFCLVREEKHAEAPAELDYDEAVAATATGRKGKGVDHAEMDRIRDLEDQLASLKTAFASLQGTSRADLLGDEGEDDDAGPSRVSDPRDDDTHYFHSYAANEIHESMLKDLVRTHAYRDFILNNPSLFKGKTVLDVGCGTGILSMFAAKAGARKVYAVDASDVAFKAKANVEENGLEGVIEILYSKVEKLQLPEKVDIIVSEWMGYFLLYESMLDSVLYARDHFLAEGGLVVPSQCSMLLAGLDDADLQKGKVDFWQNVEGFKMSVMQRELYNVAQIESTRSEALMSDVAVIKSVLMPIVTVPDLDFQSRFRLEMKRTGQLRMLCSWFDTFFTLDGRPVPGQLLLEKQSLQPTEVAFSTSPFGTQTHWQQTVFLLKKPLEVQKGDIVEGKIRVFKAEDNSRELMVEVTIDGHEADAQTWHVR